MGKIRDCVKKIGDSEGRFHAKMCMIRDGNSKDGTRAEEINKMWQEYTELYTKKKGLNDLDNHDGVITHLEPDILECEVKWALGTLPGTKLVEAMEFQWSYSKS